MTLEDLRVFVAVCRAGSLSAVARELGCTQSAVSQHVKRLEREFGVGLLERRPRGVAVTQAGRILERAARDGIAGLDLAARELRDLVDGGRGYVRLATGATTVRHFMSDAVVAFRERHPNVNLEFRTVSSGRGSFDALADGTLDLAWITLGPPVRGIEQRRVVELPWMLAVREDDEFARRKALNAGELDGIRLIRLPPNSTSAAHLDAACAESGVRFAYDTSVADWDTALLLAEVGVGRAVVPALPGLAASGAGALRLVPLPGLRPLPVGWAMRRWDALSPPARAFAELVVELRRGRPRGGEQPGPLPRGGRTRGDEQAVRLPRRPDSGT
ncbi:LysR family transcriptional regulator [Streptomyces niveiscabiei]|uniref:LysR family transcriptional regulator n=1 Tax=Streptomyces niveiscabiei TaxID=164115 RepID=UPI0029BF738A|nr:LysR family transcriptional regulator [Streptomyces niveiscabiei]MDX3383638.1 LysR family transcriptional regulator [Streptomyces niveiscabiei]